MEIWTNVTLDEGSYTPPDLRLRGSYRDMGEAEEALADLIMEEIASREEVAEAVLNDENHAETKGLDLGSEECRAKLRELILSEIRFAGGYYVSSFGDGEPDRQYWFMTMKNELEKEV